MMFRLVAIFLASAFGLVGCTELNATRLVRGDTMTAQQGPRYYLPMTQFDIVATRRVVECVRANANSPYTDLRIVTDVEVETRQIDDPDAAYAIDLRSLSNFFNATATDVSFFEGTNILHTVNADVEDKTGPAIVGAAKVVASIAGLVTGVPIGGVFGLNQTTKSAPSPLDTTCGQLDAINGLRAAVVEHTELVAKWTLYVEILSYDPNTTIDLGFTVAPPKALKDALDKLRAAQRDLKNARRALAKGLAPLTSVAKATWPETGAHPYTETDIASLSQTAFDKWYGVIRAPNGTIANNKPTVELADFNLKVEMVSLDHFGRNYMPPNADTGNHKPGDKVVVDPFLPSDGIKYRAPVRGRLLFSGKDMSKENNPPDTLATSDHEISQLGFIDAFAVRSRPFESAEYEIVFAKSGRMVSAGYKERAAPVEGALTALTGIVAATSGFIEAREDEREARRKADSEAIDTAAKRRLAELDIAAKEASLSQSDNELLRDSIKLETEILEAQVALNEAQKRLDEFQTP